MRPSIHDDLKHQLARELCAILDGRTGAEITARTGLHPSRVSRLRAGKLSAFSIAELLRQIEHHGYEFEFVIRPRRRPQFIRQASPVTVVRHDLFGRAQADAGAAGLKV